MDHALTADELAPLLSVSRLSIYKYARLGSIPCFRIGDCVRFDPSSVYDPDYIGILAALGENGRALLRSRINFQPK
jgi:excisionase family DNA binding protein